jgi:hypothetical protein
MGGDTVGAQVTSSSRMRRGALAPVKRRAGIGAQPIDGTNNRKSHQPGSFRHVTESMGQPSMTPRLRTRQHP